MWFSRLITTCLVVGVITTHCEHLHSQLNDFCTFRVQGEVFCDDYSDMNPLDDDPVTWSPIGGSTLDASSGDLVVNGRVQIEGAPDPNWRFSGASVMNTLSDVSLRTQARLAQDRSWVAITVRENNDPISNGYGFAINAVGELSYGRLADPPVNDLLIVEATDFRPTFEDVVMQVDVIDDKIDIWAWRPSEEMPASPLATIDDMTFDSGFVSVWVGGIGPDRDMSGTFRFVQVATQSITTIGGDSLDFNADNNVGVADLDLLVEEIARSGDNAVFDLTSDGVIDVDDLHEWLRAGAARNGFSDSYLFGDTNLDGNVDVEDLNNLALQWQQSVARWSGGDFTANGIVDSGDLNLLALNWRESIPLVTPTNGPVPEPSALFLTAVAFAFICQNNNGRNRGRIRKHLMM